MPTFVEHALLIVGLSIVWFIGVLGFIEYLTRKSEAAYSQLAPYRLEDLLIRDLPAKKTDKSKVLEFHQVRNKKYKK